MVQEYKLTKAYVTGVETAADADGSTGNTLSFTYGTVDHAVSTIGLDGKLTKTVGAGYDFERETTNLPSQGQVDPGPDAAQCAGAATLHRRAAGILHPCQWRGGLGGAE